MSRSSAKSGKAVVTKSLREKWEKREQSAKVKWEKEIGGTSTVTQISIDVGLHKDSSRGSEGGVSHDMEWFRDIRHPDHQG